MSIKYYQSPELDKELEKIISKLEMRHIDISRVKCVKSYGSKARQTIARCYGLSKIWQQILGIDAHYIIELISERYNKLSEDEKEKVLIHELLHIPFNMGGGFKHHKNYVTERNVEKLHEKYRQRKDL